VRDALTKVEKEIEEENGPEQKKVLKTNEGEG
jgi:hypothetical protein